MSLPISCFAGGQSIQSSRAPQEPAKVTAQSVCAVIVTYNPEPTFIDNIVTVAAQASHVVVVDNGSSKETQHLLDELETRPACKVIRNGQNLGIAVALNLGVKYAVDADFDWIATFDQDSRVCEDFVPQMVETYQQAEHPQEIALVAPVYVDRESGVKLRLRRTGKGEILAAMTSGSMIPSSVIRKLGYFDESLYIDAVDKEFCLRARRRGLSIIQSSAVLLHSLGRTTYHHWLGLRFGATNHSVGRRYYITRNSLRVLLQYATDWPWAWQEGRWIILDAAKVVLVENNKWRKFRAMLAGTMDALCGRMGKQVEL
jgi:rhamnosyltransferase